MATLTWRLFAASSSGSILFRTQLYRLPSDMRETCGSMARQPQPTICCLRNAAAVCWCAYRHIRSAMPSTSDSRSTAGTALRASPISAAAKQPLIAEDEPKSEAKREQHNGRSILNQANVLNTGLNTVPVTPETESPVRARRFVHWRQKQRKMRQN